MWACARFATATTLCTRHPELVSGSLPSVVTLNLVQGLQMLKNTFSMTAQRQPMLKNTFSMTWKDAGTHVHTLSACHPELSFQGLT